MPQYFGQLPTTDQPWVTLGAVQAIQYDDGFADPKGVRTIQFECGDSCVVISILAANLIRVRMSPNGDFIPRRSWAVTLDDSEWAIAPFEVEETETTVEITTQQIRVSVKRQNCRIACFDKANRPFVQDADMGMSWRMGTVAGWKQIEADEDDGRNFKYKNGAWATTTYQVYTDAQQTFVDIKARQDK